VPRPRRLTGALLLSTTLLAGCGRDDAGSGLSPASSSTTSTPAPPTSSATTTTTTSTSSLPGTTASPTTTQVARRAAVRAWLEVQRAAGRSRSAAQPRDAGFPRLVQAYDGQGTSGAAAIVFADGTVAEVPSLRGAVTSGFAVEVLGDRIAAVGGDRDTLWLQVLDVATSTWTAPLDLGLPSNAWISTGAAEGTLLVSSVRREGDVLTQAGVLVAADLTVTPMAVPPQPVLMTWSAILGHRAFLMGLDTTVDPPGSDLAQPWVFDVPSNSWSPVPAPDWTSGGRWLAPHEVTDTFLVATTPDGIVALTPWPDRTLGFLDAATLTWRRFDDVPFEAATPYTFLVDDAGIGHHTLAVLPRLGWSQHPEDFGVMGLLDLQTGTWTTRRLDVGAATDGSIRDWDIRSTDDVLLIGIRDGEAGPDAVPRWVVDRRTGAWRDGTGADRVLWSRLVVFDATVDDLLAAWP
jgi:hypothetical protein